MTATTRNSHTKVMDQLTTSTLQKPSFVDEAGQDFASFLDLSFTEQASSLPLPTPTLFSATTQAATSLPPATAAAWAHAFTRHDDHMLDSPLGLSPASLAGNSSINASPFEFGTQAGDFNSPLLSGVFGTPDSLDSTLATPAGEFPSLFGEAPAFKSLSLSNVTSAPVLAPTMIAVSPSIMSLDGEELMRPPTPVDVKPVLNRQERSRSTAPKVGLSRLGKSIDEIAAEDMASRQPVKDKFTGTRNTKIKPIPLDAPTIQKNYAVSSATSRKRAPSAVASKLVAAGGSTGSSNAKKRARRDSTPAMMNDMVSSPQCKTPLPQFEGVQDSSINPEDLPDELLTAIELKRRQNTLAARRSRMRKAEHLSELKIQIDQRDQRIFELEQQVLSLKQRLGE
ncbi:hypothetical protein OIO90_006210 [Microbotryomycetes sp. JL221]|nr:hypothetical protein OIO90_006210 [Microbotryomycetes sp. JL221]